MPYLNKDLSIKKLHVALEQEKIRSAWGNCLIQHKDEVYYVEPHRWGIIAVNELGKTVALSKLKDFDYAGNSVEALDYMLSDLMSKIFNLSIAQ